MHRREREGARGGRVVSELGEGALVRSNQGMWNPTHTEPMDSP